MQKARKIGVSLVAAALLLAAPWAGRAQVGDGEIGKEPGSAADSLQPEIEAALSDARLSGSKLEFQSFFSGLEEEKLPAGPFLSKVREGLAKKVEAKKILKALRTLKARYLKSRGLLDAAGIAPSAQALGAVSDMLAAGVKEAHIGSLLGELENQDEAGREKGVVLLSACLLRLRDSGLNDDQALKKTLKAYRKHGLDGVKKEMAKSKAAAKTAKYKKSWKNKNKQSVKDIHKIQGFGGPKSGKSNGQ